MLLRKFGKTGWHVSELGLGTWQAGGGWGNEFNADTARRILEAALDDGINFIDTADVYGSQQSEAAAGKAVRAARAAGRQVYLATKCGRRLNPHVAEAYTPEALRGFVEDSLKNTGLDCLDLVQLHCPPTQVFYQPEVFRLFEDLRREGKVQHLGVSVEKVEEAIKAAEYPNVVSVQIIYNMFRHRPAERFFQIAAEKDIAIIARVPLASGLLTGKITAATQFNPKDHRYFNRNGESFDKGETFSGVPFDIALQAVARLQSLFGADALVSAALKWILSDPRVNCVIPGASRPEQVHANTQALSGPALSDAQLEEVKKIYQELIKEHVHQLW